MERMRKKELGLGSVRWHQVPIQGSFRGPNLFPEIRIYSSIKPRFDLNLASHHISKGALAMLKQFCTVGMSFQPLPHVTSSSVASIELDRCSCVDLGVSIV